MITSQLLPQLTPENPYAFRLHFVGAGEGVDHAFLNQLEQLSTGQGVQMVASDHHAHLSHSHGNILDELDRAFIGRANNFGIAESEPATSGAIITRIGDLTSQIWHQGDQATFSFMPAHANIGLEFAANHPLSVPLSVTIPGTHYDDKSIFFQVLLARGTAAGATVSVSSNWTDLLKGTLLGSSEKRAEDTARQAHAAEVREAEIIRQDIDLNVLANGGIPVQATRRLKELSEQASKDQAISTSDLAPDELALLTRCGFRPRGLVTGSAMYHVGQAFR
jgi:hypothetical protein